jgi:excisionase family DNA binding protein
MVTERVRDTVERQGYNVSESARIVGVGRTTMHKMIREGRIRPVKIGTRTVIPKSEIDRLLNGTDDTRAA